MRSWEWSILIALLLSNYLVFSALGVRVIHEEPPPLPTRTPKPTFTPLPSPFSTVTPMATPSPSSTPAPLATSTPTAIRTHTVKVGETLSQIAFLYGTTVQALAEANDLEPPYIIYEGEAILLP